MIYYCYVVLQHAILATVFIEHIENIPTEVECTLRGAVDEKRKHFLIETKYSLIIDVNNKAIKEVVSMSQLEVIISPCQALSNLG